MAKISQSWLQAIIFLLSFHFLLCGHFCNRPKTYQYGTKSCPGCSYTKLYTETNCCDKWKGYTCKIPICDPPCNGGETCYGPDTCRCSNKTVGGQCSDACFPPCQHGGKCYGPNKCLCTPGYAGDFCDVNPSDIIFVVDESGSVGSGNFRVTMEYLANGVNRLPIRYDLLRVGMALFQGTVKTRFKLDQSFNKSVLTNKILATVFGSGGSTDIDRAIGYACSDMFELERGDRKHAQNILVLITDGKSSSANNPGLQKCKNKKVTIIGIGIGSSVDEKQLRSLVSKPEYYFDTTYDNLEKTLPKLIKTITDFCPPGCKNNGTCISRGLCQCPGGFKGLLCETEVTCNPECMNNGTCTDTNKCTCTSGYEGNSCTIPICNQKCRNNGTCTEPDTCVCENGFSGGLCEVDLSQTAPVYTETHVNVIQGLPKNIVIAIVTSLILLLFVLVAVILFLWKTRRLQAGIRTIRNTIRVPEAASGNNRAQMSNNDDDIYFYGAMETQGRDTWAISRQDLSLETELARGRFAIIYLAQYFNHQDVRKVVAKTLKDDQNEDNVIKMKGKINFYGTKIGHHKNILDFIGSVNDDIRGPIMILEYCPKGVLKEFLESVRSNVTVDLEERLFRMTLAICEGMDYLSSQQVVHRRLAARNVLLNDQYIPKITGFGPDPEAIKTETGDTRKSERIPIKWMAPECMKTTKYANELSDVWSYGIVMWEIFSLGETPYPGIKNTDVLSVVKRGTKMKKPELCDDVFYKIMLKCWHYDPRKRSGFEQIKEELSKLFTEETGDDDYYMYYKSNEK
ncbi:uncharacterized protein LOC143064140 [Mytilus galloprovincialis]|uniref:uncharacterized protein LOC143064140 n=1 Tax=Mytilus galloprovincialis TaxID=29158 RepID=UPI003F7BCBE7